MTKFLQERVKYVESGSELVKDENVEVDCTL